MASADDDEDHTKLQGVVIITLPPPNNPSAGKTITAFTISSSNSSSSQQHQQPPISSPIRTRPNPRPKISRTLLGISLFALITFCFSQFTTDSSTHDRDDDDRKPNSFVFPLYPKFGFGEVRDVEVKLGKFVRFSSRNGVLPVDNGGFPSEVKRVSTVLPVNGDTLLDGLYYTQIQVGNPPRPYFLDIDTGSDLTWIQCDAPCTSCSKGAHPYYKPRRENILSSKDSFCFEVQHSTGNEVCESCHQCDYEIEYADRSSSLGVLSRDDLYLVDRNGTSVDSKVILGCAYDQQGMLLNSLTKTDGILGLSRAKVSMPSQLAKQGVIENVIGQCLTTNPGGGGYMFLGGELVPHGKMSWVPMVNDDSMNYLAEVARVTYGSRQLALDSYQKGNGRVVFDSGSSYTYFTKEAYLNLISMLKDVSNHGLVQDALDTTLPICWRTKSPIRSVKDVSKFFKPLTLEFGRKWWIISMNLHIPPDGYLIISSKGNVCLGILDGSDVLDGTHIVLGDVSMRGNLMVYDNVKRKIGWMRSECVNP